MENNKIIYAKPPKDNILLEDCEFYHVLDIPGMSGPPNVDGIKGFDFRKNVNDYLGHTDFKNKTVLELGPGSGFLTFLGMKNMLRHTNEKVIVTELGGYERIKSFRNIMRNLIKKISPLTPPSMTYLPSTNKKPFVWWKFSPEIISNMASTLGFEKNTITYHKQTVDGHNSWFFTVVCERTVPIENCNYDY